MTSAESTEARARRDSAKPEDDDLETGTLADEGEQDLAKRYDEINVKTMYDMLEDIGNQKLFFLTNRQAELLAESDTTIDRLLGALEMRDEPKLLINLMVEWGFTAANRCWPSAKNWGRVAGMEYQRGPFASKQEDNETVARLERFVLEVIIPLAERTNALVIVSGLQHCALSSAFTRMLKLRKSKYAGGRPPFSVLAFAQEFYAVVANQSEDAHWRTVLRGSKAWKKRQKFLVSGVQDCLDRQRYKNWLMEHETDEQKKARAEREKDLTSKAKWRLRKQEMAQLSDWVSCDFDWQVADLNEDAPCLIIVDGIRSSFDGGVCTAEDVAVQAPFTALMNALIKRVARALPSISLQTGGSIFEHVGSNLSGSLFRSIDMANNNIPVLFLDVVERPLLSQSGSRRMLIELAKRKYIEHQERLLASGVVDAFNHCALAHFYDVLFGDGDARTTEQRATSSGRDGPVPLHVALRRQRRASRRGGSEDEGGEAADDLFSFEPAGTEEVGELCQWLVRTRFDYFMRFRRMKLPEEDIGGNQVGTEDELDPSKPGYFEKTLPRFYGDNMQAEELAMRTLLLDPKFNACNVADIKGSKLLVDTLCRTSRLPRENSVEALELLQRAWNQHDVAVHLARFYKRLGRLLYMMYIMVGQATIAVTAVFLALGYGDADDESTDPGHMQYTLFALAMAGSVVLIADRFFNPTQRGGQLRAGAAQLESIVWRFRARIGQFAVPQGNAAPKGPDYALRDCMTNWHEDLTAGTDLLSTALDKKYPSKVYRHCQLSGALTAARAGGSSRHAAATEQSKAAEIRKLDRKLERLQVEYWPEYFGPNATKQIPPAVAAILAKDPVTRKNMEAAAARRAPGTAASIAPEPVEVRPGTAAGGGELPSASPLPASSTDALAAEAIQQLPHEDWSPAEMQAHNEKIEALTKIRRQRAALLEETGAADDDQHLDDFHSPVEPEQYIALRLDRMIAYYQRKIPLFYNWRRFWELVLALCTVASATLSFLSEFTAYVAIATSLAAGVTSWNAHDDLAKRISRYTNAVRSIERLQWWWRSLDDIERASATNISLLIESGEAIISAERLAWLTAFKKEQKEKAGGSAGASHDGAEAKPTNFRRGGMSSVLGSTEA